MIRPTLLASQLLLLAWGSPLLAQGDVPSEVIAECNAAGSASSLPKCLKEGAIAYEMLELAREDGLYGDAAEPVISSCADRNESFNTTWLCFETAAEKAVETRSLIGLENIADRCVAAISDETAHTEITRIYKDKRNARFPDEMFFGGDMFYPFQGCPSEGEDAIETKAEASPTADAAPSADRLADARCNALAELEGAIAQHSADELRDIQANLAQKERAEADTIASSLGISEGSASELLSGSEADKMQMAMLLGAFLREHHPPLFQDILDNPNQLQGSPASELGGQMATGIITMMIEGAEKTYRADCVPS